MRSLPLVGIGCLSLALAVAAAHASDGVLEISQVCADTTGAGCFPGDAPGFPVTITQPGSYRLTSNLSVPADTSGLRIETSGVSIDLNGFRMLGPFVCPVPCFSGTGTGVESATGLGHRVSISNGEISGFGLDGVNLRNDAHVEHLLVTNAGRHGIVINSGSIALANRIRAVGDNGLRMNANTGLDPGIFRDNVITQANLAGAGADFASGGRATGGNGCSDGSCSQRGARRFYLTTTQRNGAQALTACAGGYRMASLWEISDPSTLEYDRTHGLVGADTGNGPPHGTNGWVRTGNRFSAPGTITPGVAHCLAWTSALGTELGTVVALDFNWSISPSSQIHPWVAGGSACDSNFRVWCVAD